MKCANSYKDHCCISRNKIELIFSRAFQKNNLNTSSANIYLSSENNKNTRKGIKFVQSLPIKTPERRHVSGSHFAASCLQLY